MSTSVGVVLLLLVALSQSFNAEGSSANAPVVVDPQHRTRVSFLKRQKYRKQFASADDAAVWCRGGDDVYREGALLYNAILAQDVDQVKEMIASSGGKYITSPLMVPTSEDGCQTSVTTPLHQACLRGNIDVANILVESAETSDTLNSADHKDGVTPLFLAAREGHVEIVKALIAKGANVNVGEDEGWTSLHSACMNSHIAVVRELIAGGANANVAEFERGITPLSLAVGNSDLQIVKELISNGGALADMPDKGGTTPLFRAVNKGRLNVVRELIKNGGAKVNYVHPAEK